MSQHKATLEKVLISSLKHRKYGSKIAETISSIEAMVQTGIDTATEVDSQNEDSIRRCRSAVAHRVYGKRMQDAWETLQEIMAAELISETAEDQTLPGQHKQSLKKTLISSMNSRKLGKQFADMADLQDKVLDDLLVIYGVGGAKDDAPTAANLQAIKDVQ